MISGGRALVLVLAALAGVLFMPRSVGAAPIDPKTEYAARLAELRAKDAQDLRRLASWADRNGLERTADADWDRAQKIEPNHEETLKRLRYVKRGAGFVRDDASWVLVRLVPDAKPDRTAEYAAKRQAEVDRPAAARHRELATWCRDVGLRDRVDVELRSALALDPSDPWVHLALGEVFDPDEGWTPSEVRARRISETTAGGVLRRLAALHSDAIRQEGDGPNTEALGFQTSLWRLREWTLETDLPDDDAAFALATVDLGARWFRDFFRLPVSERVLPHGGSFLVMSTNERYQKAVAAETRFSKAEKLFAKGLGGMPVDHAGKAEAWHAVFERPSGASAADGCLHFAVHFLMEARFGVFSREAWLYEGLAAYAVFRIAQTNDTWCVNLEETSSKIPELDAPDASTWAEFVLTTVAKRDDDSLKAMLGASLNNFDGRMLVKAWSIMRWLLEDHPGEARAFLEAKAEGDASDRALERATGLRVEDIDELWRRHVLATEGE